MFRSFRQVHFRSRAIKSHDVDSLSEGSDSDDDSSDVGGMKKSRNEMKREARRAVRWGMELASFSPSQIKRILVAGLEQEALMVVKKLGRDVREGKRRQFNYIDAAKDGDQKDSTNINVVTRWYDGLINKDISITNEIYSLREVEFNRQELRQLVRKVHLTLEQEARVEENGKPSAAAANVRRSLTLFLHGLARQLPTE
ncbi:hypothetical protein OROGR_021460 [Orobanche gracilis]